MNSFAYVQEKQSCVRFPSIQQARCIGNITLLLAYSLYRRSSGTLNMPSQMPRKIYPFPYPACQYTGGETISVRAEVIRAAVTVQALRLRRVCPVARYWILVLDVNGKIGNDVAGCKCKRENTGTGCE